MRRRINCESFAFLIVTLSLVIAASSCGGGGSQTSTPTSTPSPTPAPVAVTVSPSSASLSPKETQQFNANVTGSSNTAVNWTVALQPGVSGDPGTISPAGLYTAPATLLGDNAVVATATAQADTTKSATASIGVIDNHERETVPIALGSSGGNSTDSSQSGNKITCCSGTLGSLVSRGGTQFILSNNHVLDRSGQGTMGQQISQPGIADANCDNSAAAVTPVAMLSQAAPLQNGTNNVDAAIAQIIPGEVDSRGTILDLDALGQPAPPSSTIVGDPSTLIPGTTTLAKSGSASGLTCSTLASIGLSVKVTYQKACGDSTNNFTVIFNNEIEVTGGSFSASGDSGSLIVTRDQARPVALLFAGNSDSKTGPLDTVGNPIQAVLDALADTNGVKPQIVGGADHAVACTVNTQSQVITENHATIRQEQRNLSGSEIQRADLAMSAHKAELMRDSAVVGVDIGASQDSPPEAAVIVYVDHPTTIPHVLNGVRTRIVSSSPLPQMTRSQLVQALAVKQQNAEQLMSNSAILAVGVGASLDNPSEPTLLIHVEEGKQVEIPAEIDGIRTRVKFVQPFKAFGWGRTATRSCSRK